MLATASEIIVFMVLAGLAGFGAGWFLQRARRVDIVYEPQLPPPSRARQSGSASVDETIDLRAMEDAPDLARTTERIRALVGVADRHDDLTRIRGIGPKISLQLNQMGITSYAQIARLTDADIDLIGDALGAFSGRIHRDGWVDSARSLLEQANSDPFAPS